jgi:hypothetical protein
MPVQQDKHPEIPSLSQLQTTEGVQVTRLLASGDVQDIAMSPKSGRLIVHTALPMEEALESGITSWLVKEENLLIFDLSSDQPQIPFKHIRFVTPKDQTVYRTEPWLIDAEENLYFMGKRYAAPDYAQTKSVEIIGHGELGARISKATGIPIAPGGYSSADVTEQEREDKFASIVERFRALGEEVVAYDQSTCWVVDPGWLVKDCHDRVKFGVYEKTPTADFSLSEFISKEFLESQLHKRKELCDPDIAECWDRAVAANHCSCNHMVFGCRQSYMLYAHLSIGTHKVALKSMPQGDSAL